MSGLYALTVRKVLALSAVGSIGLGTSASGAVLINSFSNIAPAGTAGDPYDASTTGSPILTPSSTDLVSGMTATVTYNLLAGPPGSTTQESSSGEVAWTDGSIATVYGTGHAGYGSVDGRVGGAALQTYVTFDLGAFYNISQVDVFLGWNDSGRDDSSFNLLASTDNVAFTTIASYTKGPDNTGAITTPVTNLHSITDDGGAAISSGVRYIQFEFTDADNGWAGLAEVDIIGTAVPEPSSLVLLGISSLAAAGFRRRRNN